MTNEELQQVIAQADFRLDKMKDDIHDLFDENKQLKERIDKAIEYIKEHFMYHIGNDNGDIFFEDNDIQEIVEILGDKE